MYDMVQCNEVEVVEVVINRSMHLITRQFVRLKAVT